LAQQKPLIELQDGLFTASIDKSPRCTFCKKEITGDTCKWSDVYGYEHLACFDKHYEKNSLGYHTFFNELGNLITEERVTIFKLHLKREILT